MIDALLETHKVIITAGTGGVGKTTLSAAMGVRAAQLGKEVLVLTVDPAKRLATALGLNSLPEGEVLVPGQKYKGALYAAVVDSKRVFDAFVLEVTPDRETAERLFANSLYQKLSTSLSGSQEYTSTEYLYKCYKSGKYDLIILDTPPMGHAMEFLETPMKIHALFQDSVLKWFIRAFDVEESFFFRIFSRTSNLALKAFEVLTGTEFIRQLFEFLGVAYAIRIPVQERTEAMTKLLKSRETGFVLITSFDAVKISQTSEFFSDLQERGHHLVGLVVNRTFPLILGQFDARGELELKLADYYRKLEKYFAPQERVLNELERNFAGKMDILRIPDFDQEVDDLHSLEGMAQVIAKGVAP